MSGGSSRGRLLAATLRISAIVVFAGASLLVLGAAGDTLGYDYLAYDAAARRLLGGEPLYDTSFEAAGGFGLFYYPPPFILLVLPFAALLPAAAATWAWMLLLVVAFLVGVALLPVRPSVRWAIVLLAGLMWPYLYALKLGQVNALLFLCFAVGWRWLDRPAVFGASAAAGAAIKLQPGLVLVWALLAGRLRAVAVGAGVLLGLALVVTVIGGTGVWTDFVELVRRVNDPIRTEHNFTFGAVAYRMGAPETVAVILQYATIGLTLALVVIAARVAAPEAGYMVAIVASQLVSPILWDHYAMLLLLPIAYLLERGRWWAAIIPVALSLPLVSLTPEIAYLASFAVLLVALLLDSVGGRLRPQRSAEADAILAP